MSAFNGTKGKWSPDFMDNYEDGTDMPVLDSDGFPIATVEAAPILHNWSLHYPEIGHWAEGADDGRTQRGRSRGEVKANARLIAAAPDLLEALQEAAALLAPAHEAGLLGAAAIAKFQAAISRALGEE